MADLLSCASLETSTKEYIMARSSVLFALLFASATLATAAMAQAAGQASAAAEAPAAPPAPVVVGSAQPGPAADSLIVNDVKVGAGKEALAGQVAARSSTVPSAASRWNSRWARARSSRAGTRACRA
jgi:hypothetical protein